MSVLHTIQVPPKRNGRHVVVSDIGEWQCCVAFGSWLRGTLDALLLNRRRRENKPSPSANSTYGWNPNQLPPSRAEAFAREYICIPTQMTEGFTRRGNGNGGPTTPKPRITPKPQSPRPRTNR